MYKVNTCSDHVPKLIFDCNNINFYSSNYEGARLFNKEKALVFNLTSEPHKTNIYSIPQLNQYLESSFDEIVMGWEDGGIPSVSSGFWKAFINYINIYKNVCIHCQMGHGRTGTALAVLMVVACGVTAEEAITTVRERHCSKAVETEEQVAYVYDIDMIINGRDVPAEIPIHGSIFSIFPLNHSLNRINYSEQ